MTKPGRLLLYAGFVLLACGGLYAVWTYWPTPKTGAPVVPSIEAPVTPASAPLAVQPTQAIADHLPAALVASPDATPMALDDSDPVLRRALSALMGELALEKFFLSDQMVRKFVATVDNLPRQEAPMQMMPVKPIPGAFQVDRTPDAIHIAAGNTKLYVGFIDAVSMVNPNSLVGLYARNYPLFQQAYRELGYPKGYFNDRLLAAIDDLLATEDVPAPMEVLQPKVLFVFAQPEVENRSAGQKIMTRIGTSNAQRLKKLLRALRNELDHLDAQGTQPLPKVR